MKNQSSKNQRQNNGFMNQQKEVLTPDTFGFADSESIAPPANMWARIENALASRDEKMTFANDIINAAFNNSTIVP